MDPLDPLRFAIATVPLAAYLLVLGVVNLRRQPLLTSGAADLLALGMAATGLVFVGPIELFRPEPLTADLGNAVWLFWIAFYWTGLALAVLVMRPRLVVYNASLDELRPAVVEAVGQLEPDARWAGDSVSLPRLGVQLHLEAFGIMRNTSLVSSGGQQNLDGWRRLRKALGRSLKPVQVPPNPRSVSFLVMAGFLLAVSISQLVAKPVEVAKTVTEILAF